MRYRSTLNLGWAAVSLLWIAWCLCWPFYARCQDTRAIEIEAADTYKVCVQQNGMTAVACATDRGAYTQLNQRLAWPPERNAYQSFAGKRLADALSFFTVLCLLPVLFGYLVLRAALETVIRFARVRSRNLALRS